MPYNFAADSLHTKKLCSRLSSSKVRFWKENGRFGFLSLPLWGDLGVTYDDHLWLIGKRVVDFLLVLTELFSLGVTAIDYQFKIAYFSPTGAGLPKISDRRGHPHQPFFFSENPAK